MTEKPTVVEALTRVMTDVKAVGRDGVNTTQKYRFRGVDSTVNAVSPALRAHGVVIVPLAEEIIEERYQSKDGKAMKSVVLKVRWRFYGPAGDFIEAVTYGEGADVGDKAVPKAHSVAFRTALLQSLCLPTDETDPDAVSHERVEGVKNEVSGEEMTEIAKHLGTCDSEAFKIQARAMRMRWNEFSTEQQERVTSWVNAAKLRLGGV